MRKMTNVKKIKKSLKTLIIASLAVSVCLVSGCGGTAVAPGESEVEQDDNKTQLTIATFDGGLGTEWIREAATRFEKKFAETSFEDGKKGVQVKVLKSSNYSGNYVLETLQSEVADVWFTEGINYADHINAGNFADITDIVTEDLSKYGDKGTIEDKIDEGFLDFLNVGTKDKSQYYAIPFYDGFYGLVYDKDLFEEKNLYFKSSGTEVGDAADGLGFVTSASDVKSAGVDGKLGTYDDGLPATYKQFLSLVDKMVENDITPFVYGGSNAMEYTLRTMASFWAQAEGAEGYRLNYTLNGTADNLAKLDSNGKVVTNADGSLALETSKITTDNGYELQRQVSKYYVLDLFHRILEDSDNYSNSNLMHTAAQSDFLKGKQGDYTTYGMLIDGTWWENEADESFKALTSRFGDEYARGNRNLGFMPLPVPTSDAVGNENVLLNTNSSLAFIRSTTEVLDCAKAFLQFTTTEAELSAFTASVSMTRSFEYELVDEYKDKLTSYARSLYELKNTSSVIYPYSSEELFQNNQAFFSTERWSWNTLLNNAEYGNPWQLWLSYSQKYQAEQYFEGMYELQKTKWGTLSR